MTVRINKQKINLREKLAGVEDKVNFDEVVRGLGENTAPLVLNKDGGNVGIGTASPNNPLEVKSAGGKYGLHVLHPVTNDSLGGFFVETDNTTSLYLKDISKASPSTIRLKASGDSYFNGGNVGIGTTSPDEELHIEGDNAPYIKVEASDNTDSGIALAKQSVNKWFILNDADQSDNFAIRGDGGGTDEFLTIKQDGNVGIGTTNPLATFVISGGTDDTATNLEYSCSNGDARIEAIQRGNSNIYSPIRYFAQKHIFASGNVGIGTTDPGSYKLNVNGTASVVHSVNGSEEVTSDDRVKHNEQPIIGALETLSKITPKKYIKTTEMYDANHDFELDADGNPIDSNGEPVEHRIEAGVIAQQVLTVDELAFAVSPEGVDEDGTVTSPHGLDYNSLFTYAIAAIQEQQQTIEDLKSRIETLEQQ